MDAPIYLHHSQFEHVAQVLADLNLPSYLDPKSVISLVSTSKNTKIITYLHICKTKTFILPTQSTITFYRKAARVCLTDILLSFGTTASCMGLITPNFTHLTIGNRNYHPTLLPSYPKTQLFNQISDNIPVSITHLHFGCNFNHRVDHLPSTVTHLSFGFFFQPTCRSPSQIFNPPQIWFLVFSKSR